MMQADVDEGRSAAGLTTAEREDLLKLHRELRLGRGVRRSKTTCERLIRISGAQGIHYPKRNRACTRRHSYNNGLNPSTTRPKDFHTSFQRSENHAPKPSTQ